MHHVQCCPRPSSCQRSPRRCSCIKNSLLSCCSTIWASRLMYQVTFGYQQDFQLDERRACYSVLPCYLEAGGSTKERLSSTSPSASLSRTYETTDIAWLPNDLGRLQCTALGEDGVRPCLRRSARLLSSPAAQSSRTTWLPGSRGFRLEGAVRKRCIAPIAECSQPCHRPLHQLPNSCRTVCFRTVRHLRQDHGFF